MKYFQSKTSQLAITAILLLLLLFPIGVQAAHGFKEHQHESCQDFHTHLHEKQLDCFICDFHFSIFDFNPKPLPILFDESDFNKLATLPFFFKSDSSIIHYFLRGPPSSFIDL